MNRNRGYEFKTFNQDGHPFQGTGDFQDHMPGGFARLDTILSFLHPFFILFTLSILVKNKNFPLIL